MALTAGTRLGPYVITAPLAAGGMGEVYRARDTKLDRDVAIKVLPDLVSHDPERLARFEREAKTLASLNHPNIAIVHGFEETNGTTALVMELVEGVTLAARIAGPADSPESAGSTAAGQPIPLDEALPIARQIAEALEAAHEHGVVHRDLKPANVMVREDGTVKVLDFGLAKPALSEVSETAGLALSQAPTLAVPTMTQAGMILGTAAYMSPEQAKGRDADKRSDIWAFGCVLYEMLTGSRAFPGADLAETLAAVIRSEPDWAALPPDTPASIHRLLHRCLTKDRKARLADTSSLRIEIDDARRPEQGPTASRTFRRERLAWATGVLLLGLVSAFALAGVVRQAPRESEIRFDIAMPPDLDILSLAISPDGQRIAFVARADGRPNVWIHTLDGRAPRPLEGTDDAQDRVFWSPDSGSLGVFAGGKLKRIDLQSGAVQTLADAPLGAGGAWSRDGVILFAPTRGPLFRVSQGGGTVTERHAGRRTQHPPCLAAISSGRATLPVLFRGRSGPSRCLRGRSRWRDRATTSARRCRRRRRVRGIGSLALPSSGRASGSAIRCRSTDASAVNRGKSLRALVWIKPRVRPGCRCPTPVRSSIAARMSRRANGVWSGTIAPGRSFSGSMIGIRSTPTTWPCRRTAGGSPSVGIRSGCSTPRGGC